MYLKKLEISGFKSFADKTKIEFEKGITAIVGPNGSGKSNITEALRWALGEQSVKSLRGGKMPDIIFAGTQRRKSLNFAEVTAYFDNSDHYLDSEENEVTVTRRLYRNGDSDFLINGKKKRLKDVHDLFMDTGLGRDSFSIISQGRIESVFSSKPEARRMIIEEAAGVLKYKTRKQDTTSKLSTTQENLDRLEDIIYELSGQLAPLKKQKENALAFQELEANRLKLALSVLLSQIKREKVKYESSKRELEDVLKELSELGVSQKSFDTEIFSLKSRQAELESERDQLQTQILELTNLKSETEKKIEIFDLNSANQEKSEQERESRLSDLTAEQLRLTSEISEKLNKQAALENQKEKLNEQVLSLNQELANFSESPEMQTEKLREAFLQLVNQEAQLSNQLTKNESETENLLRQQADSASSNRERTEKLAQQKAELESLLADYSEQQELLSQTLEEFKEKDVQSRKVKEAMASAEAEQFKCLEQLNKKRAQLNSLENIRENHSNLYAGVRAAMSANLSGLIGVVADQLSFDRKYETALEVALGAGAQNIITENEQAAQSAIRHLRERQLGRATFLPLTTIKTREFRDFNKVSQLNGFIDLASNLVNFDSRLQPAISNLLGTTVVAETVEQATAIARQMNFSVRIVTLDGTLISPGGSYAGGSRASRNNSTFINNEIESLKVEVRNLDERLKGKEETVKALRIEQEQLTEALTVLREKGEQQRLTEKETELKLSQVKQNKEDLEALLAFDLSDEQGQSLSRFDEENQKIKEQLVEIRKKKEELDEELDLVKSSSSARNALQAEKSEALTKAKVELSTVISELSFVNSEHERYQEELAKATNEIESLSKAEAGKISNEERLRLSEQLSTSSERLDELNVRQVSLRFERDDLVAQIEDLTEQNSDLIQKNQGLHDQKTRLELQIEQSEAQLRRRHAELTEEYQMSFDLAESESESISEEDFPKAEKELRGFERQIRALGPINLDAIAQFEEVNSRYEFLNRQKDDLLEAKNLLLGTINEMDDEMKIRFKSAYEAIRNSFKLTFSQMFGGGEADLILTSDDLLTAGIDIIAQPPGKRLGSLTLMSGGEKALTALALLFAILRVRTVPFVVLDEVEAALDEANVKRFGDYMNHFDNSNQFIVVTHRKGTMAAAQVMYGVTMSEAGISKLVSVRFDKEAS